MKAILLSAGLGKRLQPVTLTTPKCLVRINDKPMLQHWIEKLVPLGVTEFLINTHYMSDEVEN
jgi:mannose-1-phosphate guanylyltransferase